MTEKPENPPAFPMPDQYTPDGQPVMQGCNGMSLRDFFAAHQLTRIGIGWPNKENMRQIATNCYAMADAMLAARAKSDPTP